MSREGGFREGEGLGARWLGGDRCRFVVWAPLARTIGVHITAPVDRLCQLTPSGDGYFGGEVAGLAPGARYLYRLDEAAEFPDPASRSQPDGVHAPSEICGR